MYSDTHTHTITLKYKPNILSMYVHKIVCPRVWRIFVYVGCVYMIATNIKMLNNNRFIMNYNLMKFYIIEGDL